MKKKNKKNRTKKADGRIQDRKKIVEMARHGLSAKAIARTLWSSDDPRDFRYIYTIVWANGVRIKDYRDATNTQGKMVVARILRR